MLAGYVDLKVHIHDRFCTLFEFILIIYNMIQYLDMPCNLSSQSLFIFVLLCVFLFKKTLCCFQSLHLCIEIQDTIKSLVSMNTDRLIFKAIVHLGCNL